MSQRFFRDPTTSCGKTRGTMCSGSMSYPSGSASSTRMSAASRITVSPTPACQPRSLNGAHSSRSRERRAACGSTGASVSPSSSPSGSAGGVSVGAGGVSGIGPTAVGVAGRSSGRGASGASVPAPESTASGSVRPIVWSTTSRSPSASPYTANAARSRSVWSPSRPAVCSWSRKSAETSAHGGRQIRRRYCAWYRRKPPCILTEYIVTKNSATADASTARSATTSHSSEMT